ncbi:hypothetical protein F383_23935 [Gossypium arboreum]|uniref:Uncharacterized protein n=1 Tax=Gossypium arboreum TaxID=29729 RepID=A0A0B0MNT8_GOSAR|nr:hypothetical protein F383_23935 [Gossypium arboreum]
MPLYQNDFTKYTQNKLDDSVTMQQ